MYVCMECDYYYMSTYACFYVPVCTYDKDILNACTYLCMNVCMYVCMYVLRKY